MGRWAAARHLLSGQRERVWSWVILCCVLLFVAAVRFRLRDMPLERDEGEFAYAGQLLLQGILPGKLAYTMKLPGTHMAYALLMALFGQSCAGVHFGFLIVNCATIVLMFLFTRALIGGLAGVVAGSTYALLSLSADTLGTAGHATHFVVLFAVAGLLLLWHASRAGLLIAYLGSGLLLGISVLMKHNGLLFVLFGAVWLVWLGIGNKLGPNVSFLKAGLVFLAGTLAPLLLLVLVLWCAGTLKDYWFWAVTYAQAYAKPNPGLMLIWRIFRQRMPAVMELPFYASFLGLAVLWARRSSRSLRAGTSRAPVALFATGLLLVSLVAVVPGMHFRPHYYVLLLPALAFLTGALVQGVTDWLWGWRFKFLAVLPVLAFTFLFAKGIVRERNFFFRATPVGVCRLLYGSELFPQARVVANYIREHSTPGARIAVLGSEPEIYFYSRRRSATGYIYTYPLAERQPYATQMRQEMRQEIETAEAEILVLVRNWTSWQPRPGSPQRLRELWDALTPPHYKLIGACDFHPSGTGTTWRWEPEVLEEPPNSSSDLLVFRRVAPETGTQ